VFLLNLAGGKPVRVTEDRDSGLPRYYYSRFDHYLSRTWSPDGSELILVCNRGRIWGTGGLWRMKAEPGATMREIHFEETNWKARPDWSRDGRRLVYSAYLGRQTNQLWLVPADGGDVLALSYGDFDATAPRWSPDGTAIAYVSNEAGNTSLVLMSVPGAKREHVEIKQRTYLHPTGVLRVHVRERGSLHKLPARLSISGKDGRSYAPDDAWRHGDEAFDRAERRFEYNYFHTGGNATVTVPAGELTIEALRGLEYRIASQRVSVASGETREVVLELERLDDLPARGLWSGDLHVHMNYGGAYRNDPQRLVLQARAEDVHVVESLIVNKEQRVPDIGWFSGRPDPASTRDTLIVFGQEYHTSYWGHLGLLGLRDHVLLPAYAAYAGTAAASLEPMNATIADLAHEQGALVGYVHPFDADPDPADEARSLTNEMPVDIALGKVDYYEALGFEDSHWATAKVWYRLLDCGFRIPAGAGTDAMANYSSLRGPLGLNRVFVRSGATLDHPQWLAALKAGRTFVSNGPLLSFTLEGKDAGDDVMLPTAGALHAMVGMKSIVPVDRVEIVRNGRVVAQIELSGDHTIAEASLNIEAPESGWYLLRAYAETSRAPILDLHPYATTSPIYVSVAGRPVRSSDDARYFVAWIDRLIAAAEAHGGWNTPAEKASVLERLRAARAVFVERL
jgi:hypothetical protein